LWFLISYHEPFLSLLTDKE